MWFGPNGLTLSTDLPATIVNQVCGQPGDSGAPVTVNNRLVGHDPRRLHRGPAHLHRLVHSVAHPGGDDVDERGNRRRHLDDRTGRRCDLLDEPGQLRPGVAWDQRADHPHPGPQPLRLTHDGLAFAICYPKSTTGCCAPCSPPTSRQLHRRYEKRCTPLTFTSHNASRMPGCCPP